MANSSPTKNHDAPLIITISGDLGSGKSLLSNALVQRWEADRYSTGVVQRRLAEKMGITTLELNRRAETDKSIDDQIDSVFRNLAKTPKNLVVDSRMAWHFLPQSFKIKLEVHPKVAASRIGNDKSRVGEGDYETLEDVMQAITDRKGSERERFLRYYNVDIEDQKNYDLVVNTTDVPPESVSDLVNEAITLWRNKEPHEHFWMSPRHVFTNVNPATLSDGEIDRLKVSWPRIGQWGEAAPLVARNDGYYILDERADYLSAAIKSGKRLMPFRMDDAKGPALPDQAAREAWEKDHDFTYMVAP